VAARAHYAGGVITQTARTLWAEPRAPGAPARVWRDWALVAVLAPTAVLEGVLRPDVAWRPFVLVVALALLPTLLWRRTHPLAMAAIGFGTGTALGVAGFVGGLGESAGLDTTVFIVLLLYALLRWGSGREIVIGLGIVLVAFVVGVTIDYTGVLDTIAAFVFLILLVLSGATVRFWTTSQTRAIDQVRLRERELLARELHDTVAHHVSAIVVRAQAGRVVAASDPAAAVEALEVVEAEGSRTLVEMRAMVGALREGEAAELAPQRGIADIERLADGVGGVPRVEVHFSGDLDDLRPSVGAAIYRIAQESITNAVRHARHATCIDVLVDADAEWVRLTIRDDGEQVAGVPGTASYGVVGMRERATLLGGSLEAGPGPDRGWAVDALLPRTAPV